MFSFSIFERQGLVSLKDKERSRLTGSQGCISLKKLAKGDHQESKEGNLFIHRQIQKLLGPGGMCLQR
jgi:hypothetical protein